MVVTPGYLAVEVLHTALRDALPWKDQDAPWYLALVLGAWRAVPLSDLGVGKDAVADLVGLKALVPDGGAALEAAAGRALSGDVKGASADFGQALSGLIETPLFGHLVARLKQRLPPAPRRRRHVMAKDLQPGEEYEHLAERADQEFGPASDEWAREQAKQNTEFGPAADEWAREQAEKAAGEEEEEGEGEKPPATPPQPAPPPPAPPASGAGKVFIALGVGLGVAGLIALIALLARRRRAIVLPPVPPLPPQVAG